MLTRLKVKGFKNLQDVDVRFGPFTCIVGLNGVGKSNLFDAIHFLSLLAKQTKLLRVVSVADTARGSLRMRAGRIVTTGAAVGGEHQRRLTFAGIRMAPGVTQRRDVQARRGPEEPATKAKHSAGVACGSGLWGQGDAAEVVRRAAVC